MIKRLNYMEINSKAIGSLIATNKHISSIPESLRAMIELRISQINGCGYCVDLHAQQARDAGETQQRIDCVAAWHETTFFDARERAAFAWAEALTHVSETHAPDAIYNELNTHFSEQEIVDLTLIAALMNAWNRVAIGFRHQPDRR